MIFGNDDDETTIDDKTKMNDETTMNNETTIDDKTTMNNESIYWKTKYDEDDLDVTSEKQLK